MQILLASEDREAMPALIRAIEHQGAEVSLVLMGELALEMQPIPPPDLAVIDVGHLDLSGREALGGLGRLGRIPIIVLTTDPHRAVLARVCPTRCLRCGHEAVHARPPGPADCRPDPGQLARCD